MGIKQVDSVSRLCIKWVSIVPFYQISLSVVPCSECEVQWMSSSGVGTLGGEFQVTSSVEECLDTCLSDPDCVAVDVSGTGPALCFLHTNASLTSQESYNNSVITQYRLLNRCLKG